MQTKIFRSILLLVVMSTPFALVSEYANAESIEYIRGYNKGYAKAKKKYQGVFVVGGGEDKIGGLGGGLNVGTMLAETQPGFKTGGGLMDRVPDYFVVQAHEYANGSASYITQGAIPIYAPIGLDEKTVLDAIKQTENYENWNSAEDLMVFDSKSFLETAEPFSAIKIDHEGVENAIVFDAQSSMREMLMEMTVVPNSGIHLMEPYAIVGQ